MEGSSIGHRIGRSSQEGGEKEKDRRESDRDARRTPTGDGRAERESRRVHTAT